MRQMNWPEPKSMYESGVGASRIVQNLGTVELLVQGVDVGEVTRLSSGEQCPSFADRELVRCERGTSDRDRRLCGRWAVHC